MRIGTISYASDWLVVIYVVLFAALASACELGTDSESSLQPSSQSIVASADVPEATRPAAEEKVQCDQFQVQAERVGSDLEVWIETDLPDSTQIWLSVYWAVGDDDRNAVKIFGVSSDPLSRWKSRNRIAIDDTKFVAVLTESMQVNAQLGRPISLGRVDSAVNVIVGLMAPSFQEDSRFEVGLEGEAVIEQFPGYFTVSGEASVDWPYTGGSAVGPFGDPDNLALGKTYVLQRETMLMKYHEVRSDASAVDEIMGVGSLPAGTWFTVHQRLEKARQQIWYQVVAEGYMGWINGVALTAQVLPVLAPPVAAGDILPMLKTILRFPDEAKAGCYDEAPEDIADCVNTVVDSYESLIVGFARAAYDRDLASIAAVAVVRCGGAAGDLEGLQFAAEWDVLDWVNRCAIREYRKNIKPLGGEQAVIEVKKK